MNKYVFPEDDFTVAGAHGKYAPTMLTSTPLGQKINHFASIENDFNPLMDEITEIPRQSMYTGSKFQRKLRLVNFYFNI